MKWYEFLGISVCRKCGSFSTNHESLYPVSCQKTELRLHCRFREGTLSQYYSLTHLVVKSLSLSFLLLSKRSYKNNFLNSISRLHPGRKKAARLTSNALAGLIARFEFSWILHIRSRIIISRLISLDISATKLTEMIASDRRF